MICSSVRTLLVLAGVSVGMLAGDARIVRAADSAIQPNILWLSCEDISPHIGCYGDAHAITPNIDRLAEEGMRFGRV